MAAIADPNSRWEARHAPLTIRPSGIISTSVWTMAPNGIRYLYFWAKRWAIVTDKVIGEAVGLREFRSSERWQLLALNEVGEVLGVFPGCQVKGFCACETPPELADSALYAFGGGCSK